MAPTEAALVLCIEYLTCSLLYCYIPFMTSRHKDVAGENCRSTIPREIFESTQPMAGNRMRDLKGKVAVVLGASAEGGTGWAIAEALAAEGAKVVVGARTFAPLQRLAERIGGTAVACD